MQLVNLVEEAGRQLTICNACRYCEGFCPVFPAMELRREFKAGDVYYLSHLCHDCRACYYACMYAPPHEYAVNLPQVLTDVRVQTYQEWSWPEFLARSFSDRRLGWVMAVAAFSLVLLAGLFYAGPSTIFAPHAGPGSFYAVVPFLAILIPAVALVFCTVLLWAAGALQFFKLSIESEGKDFHLRSIFSTIVDVALLRWMKGGGPGCYYPQGKPSSFRRVCHTLIVAGFCSAAVSTMLASIYQDLLHRMPPYPFISAPVLFGTVGGVLMVPGVIGLLIAKRKNDPEPSTPEVRRLDYVFLVLLGLTAITGLLLLALRGTAAMGTLLIVHLAVTAALFVTAPYGKFVHSVYRTSAILLYHVEQLRTHRSQEKAE